MRSFLFLLFALCCISPHPAFANTATANTIQLTQFKPADSGRLFAMKPGEKAKLALPLLGKRTVVLAFIQRGENGVEFWHGHLLDMPGTSVMFRRQLQQLSGVITLPETHYQLSQKGQSLVLSRGTLPPASTSRALLTATPPLLPRSLSAGQWAVTLDQTLFKQAQPGDEVHLTLPDQTQVPLVFKALQTDINGVQTWTGYARDDGPGFDAIISMKGGVVEGSIRTREHHYALSTVSGQTILTDRQQAGQRPLLETRDTKPVPAQSLPHTAYDGMDLTQLQPVLLLDAPMRGTGFPCMRGVCGSGVYSTWNATPITILVAYDTLLGNGDTNAAQALISSRIATANAAYANSGVQVRLQLVRTEPISGYPNNENSTALDELPAPDINPLPTNALFSGLPNLRNAYAADLVIFMRPFTFKQNEQAIGSRSCGIAYLLGGDQGGVSGIAAAGDSAYGVVSDGTSNGHYCDELTLAHEVGHLMGSAHDLVHAGTAGVFSYSYGYGIENSFGTVMSYIQPSVGLFSSPGLMKCGTSLAACGTNSANNVLSINSTRHAVASFR